jgi:pyruvate dehydrogenase E2 component (dihydrolipoamide acetyltransferase)
VPDIGDAEDVEVIEVAVAVGDEVGPDDLLVVVESDKASMEIPAGQAGTITAVHVSVGSSVEAGSLLVTIAGGQLPAPEQEPSVDSSTEAQTVPEADVTESALDVAQEPSAARSEPEPVPDSTDRKVYAGPAVRRLARELGVDLASVKGTGSRGRVVKDDVKDFVKGRMTASSSQSGASGIPRVPEIDFAKFGPIETQALSRIRVAGAGNLHRSWLNIPHVTQMEEADVTELEEFRRSLKEEALRRSLKITPLAFIIKACCYALKTYPGFNASLHGDGRNFVLKKYYHIGFAVDTEEGLVVPVIRDADRLGIWELSEAIAELAEKARTQSLSMNDMRGGSFSVSSLGSIGGTGFTPIINAPEVAILGVSRLTTKPIWDGSAFQPRQMLPLSLSYDHRAINGAEAGRFLVSLSELLGDIRRLAL